MSRQGGDWDVEFYEDPDGAEPAREFLHGLSSTRRNAALAAIEHVLVPRGIDVCKTEWGKNLGGGLYELRIRHTAAEIEQAWAADGVAADAAADGDTVLLRIYFMTAGRMAILLTGGYDKAKDGGGKKQKKSIKKAGKLVAKIKRERK